MILVLRIIFFVLRVTRNLKNRNLLIMDKGKIVEMGEADKTMQPIPINTKRLINSIQD